MALISSKIDCKSNIRIKEKKIKASLATLILNKARLAMDDPPMEEACLTNQDKPLYRAQMPYYTSNQSQQELEIGQAETLSASKVTNFEQKKAILETFPGAIRIVLDGKCTENRKANGVEIFNSISAKFGNDSEIVKNIVGIGRHATPYTWIVVLKNQQANISNPIRDFVDKFIEINGKQVCLEDASIAAVKYRNKLTGEISGNRQERYSDLTFRIQGLPIIIDPVELTSQFQNLGFKVPIKSFLSRVLVNNERMKKLKIYSELVDFKISCLQSVREKKAKMANEYEIQLKNVSYKIKITYAGFCFGCKEAGHIIKDCKSRKVKVLEKKIVGHATLVTMSKVTVRIKNR